MQHTDMKTFLIVELGKIITQKLIN